MFKQILTDKKIYLVLSRREVSRMLKYIGKNNGNATCETFNLTIAESSTDPDLQASFTEGTGLAIYNARKRK